MRDSVKVKFGQEVRKTKFCLFFPTRTLREMSSGKWELALVSQCRTLWQADLGNVDQPFYTDYYGNGVEYGSCFAYVVPQCED